MTIRLKTDTGLLNKVSDTVSFYFDIVKRVWTWHTEQFGRCCIFLLESIFDAYYK